MLIYVDVTQTQVANYRSATPNPTKTVEILNKISMPFFEVLSYLTKITPPFFPVSVS